MGKEARKGSRSKGFKGGKDRRRPGMVLGRVRQDYGEVAG
jgi:hypothetical protein